MRRLDSRAIGARRSGSFSFTIRTLAADLVISAKEVPILPCYVVFLSQYPPDSSKNCGQLLHEWDVTSNS